MKRLFVDTAAWVAIFDRTDADHQAALRFWESCKGTRVAFITSDYVLDESYTNLRLHAGLPMAMALHDLVEKSKIITVAEVDKNVRQDAWEIFVRYEDKEWSFTDCTSFVLMRRQAITDALTFDHHFRQMGYVVQPSV